MRGLIMAGALLPLLGGCVTSKVEEYITTQPQLGAEDSVVILTNRQDAVVEAEQSFSECLVDNLGNHDIRAQIISEEQFKDALFPWFEPRLAPNRPELLGTLLDQPEIARRVDDMNVRYLVWIHGESEARNKQGMMTCTLTTAGGGCVGVLSWDNNSEYEASIWDMEKQESVGLISSEATGTSMVPALGIPIPLIARTKSASCKGLADQLGAVLAGAAVPAEG